MNKLKLLALTALAAATVGTGALSAAPSASATETIPQYESTITFDLGDGVAHVLRFQSAHQVGQTLVLSGVTAPPALQSWVTRLDVTWEVAEYLVGDRKTVARFKTVARYYLENVWLSKWTRPEFDASKNEISIETLELTHEGIHWIDAS